MSLILASKSEIRAAMLTQAGLIFDVLPPAFDEEGVKREGLDGEQLAKRLAEGKAASIRAGSDGWIIGSDSTVSVDGRRFSKPGDRDEAAEHLRAFSGRIMLLSSARSLSDRLRM